MINSILSYVQCARQSGSAAEVTQSGAYFYEYEEILKAKELIYQEIGERVVQRRKQTIRAKCVAELEDILNAFGVAEDKNIVLPTYTALGLNALPPANGFQFFKDTLDVIIDEIQNLKNEIESLKNQREAEDSKTVLKAINDLKTSLKTETQAISRPPVPHGPRVNKTGGEHHETHLEVEPGTPSEIPNSTAGRDDDIWPRIRAARNGLPPTAQSKQTAVKDKPAKMSNTGLQKQVGQTLRNAIPRNQNSLQLPANRTAPERKKRDVIRGNRDPVGAFTGAERQADLFIGGCNTQVKEDDITEYCKNVLKVDIYECTPLVTKSTRFKSLASDSWPKGIVVRKFIKPRGEFFNKFSLNTDVGNKNQVRGTNVA